MVRPSQALVVLSCLRLEVDLSLGRHEHLERELSQSGHLDVDVCPVTTEEFPQPMFSRAPVIRRFIMQGIDEGCGDENSSFGVRESMEAGKSGLQVEDVFEDVAAQHRVELADGRIRTSQVEDSVPVPCVQIAHHELATLGREVHRGLVRYASAILATPDL